jgi:hypothetical protein
VQDTSVLRSVTILLAVERNEAARDAIVGLEGLVKQQASYRLKPGAGCRRRGVGSAGVDHGQVDAAEDALLAGPG